MLESGAFSCMVLNQLWFAPYKHGCPANFFCLSVCNMLWIPQWTTKGGHVCICIWVVPVVGTSNLKNVQIWCIFQVMSKEVTAYLTTMSRTNSCHKTKRPPHRVSWFCFVTLKEIKLSFFFVIKYLYPLKKILSHLQKNTWYSCSTLTVEVIQNKMGYQTQTRLRGWFSQNSFYSFWWVQRQKHKLSIIIFSIQNTSLIRCSKVMKKTYRYIDIIAVKKIWSSNNTVWLQLAKK
jgi:hypothetical protein